jgi:yecA family protein
VRRRGLDALTGRSTAHARLHRVTHGKALVTGNGNQEFVAPEERLVGSWAKRYRSVRFDLGDLLPPDLRTFGSVPFGPAQRVRLNAWLSEAGWSRKRMDIAELEGYLVALIAWPVAISSGAWLPSIWGERGWKVSTKIASQSQYDEFVALIVGFMRDLDQQLSQPSRFESSVLRGLRGSRQAAALHRWGQGFTAALTLGSQGLKGRSAARLRPSARLPACPPHQRHSARKRLRTSRAPCSC